MFASQFMPGATLEQLHSLSELQRRSATPRDAVRLLRAMWEIDVSDSLRQCALARRWSCMRAATCVARSSRGARSPA